MWNGIRELLRFQTCQRGLNQADLGEEILVSGHLIRDLEVEDRPRMLLMMESMECGAHSQGLLGDTVGFGECETECWKEIISYY